MRASKPIAVRTNCAAGRACRSTPAGSATSRSELAGTAGPPPRRCATSSSAGPGRGHDRGGDRALDERRVDEPDVPLPSRAASSTWRTVRIALPRSPSTIDAVALVGAAIAARTSVPVGAEPAVRTAARGLDADLRPGHLRGERRRGPAAMLPAVRYDYDADHAPPMLGGCSLNHRSRFDNAECK